jgi:hypothetical protein
MTRITITCEDCGRRHRLERPVAEAGIIWIVCHECELPIQAMFDLPAETAPVSASPSRSFEATWAGTLDLSTSGGVRPSF